MLYRVNVGGAAIAATPAWQSDLAASPTPYLVAGSGSNQLFSTSSSINLSHPSIPAGTSQALFQTERYDSAGGAEMSWEFPVTPGSHEVRLYFAEIYSGAQSVGARVMDVAIEGQLVLNDYDVFGDVGANAGVVKSFAVMADSLLEIDFLHVNENPAVKAIEILSGAPPSTTGSALVTVEPGGTLGDSSTYTSGSFSITNQSSAGEAIEWVRIDLSTTVLPDLVFDPAGTAGDTVGKDLTIDSGGALVGAAGHTFLGGHGGGYDALEVSFNDFDPGETVTFSLDVDPTSLLGVTAPGPEDAASVSGLELIGATVSVRFGNGSTHTAPLYRTPSSFTGSQAAVATALPPVVGLEIPALASVPATVANASLTARLTGPAGATVALVVMEGALLLQGVPGGGFDVDPYEANKAIGVTELAATIGAAGYVDIPVTLSKSHPAGGLNHLIAAIKDPQGRTGPLAHAVVQFEPASGGGTGSVVYRVNAGGPEIAGSPSWQADSGGSPAPYLSAGSSSAQVASTAAAINTAHASLPAGTPAALFQTERWDAAGGAEMAWAFPVSAGQYEVRLYFAETYSGTSALSARVFDVSIENQLVLDNYDVYAEVGGNTGVVKSFQVSSDETLNIDFGHVVENPAIKAIEVIRAEAGNQLGVFPGSVLLDDVPIGQFRSQSLDLINLGAAGDPTITIDPSQARITGTHAAEYSVAFPGAGPFQLAVGTSLPITVSLTPSTASSKTATLEIVHTGQNSPLRIPLLGSGAAAVPVGFGKSTLAGEVSSQPTSLQFGPDGRLYVAQQDGLIHIYSINRSAANTYQATATETITSIQSIPNHNDDGAINSQITTRLITGMLVAGTAANPVIYVASSDPRIGAGPSATDLNLDTNSGIISRLIWNGSNWTKLDLVRGLPRSEENHATNGMQLDATTGILYVAQGGNTNMGAPSNNFALLPEYALSAAVLSINLNQIGNSTYDLPTLNDEGRTGTSDANDPFGGNDGKNQALLVPGGPVQVYAPGFRNPYDVLLHSSGTLYTVDNGPNAGWGNVPIGEGPAGSASNDPNEPGTTYGDSLHHITGPGYYGGHPNPTRSNPANTFNSSNPQSPVSSPNPVESDYRVPGSENGALAVFGASTNGITEYTASNFQGALQGDLLVASFDKSIKRIRLTADGNAVAVNENLFNSVGTAPLDVTAIGDTGPFPGTIWVADVYGGGIFVFEPNDFGGTPPGGGDPNDSDGDGYSNDDELANGTNPNSAADVPADWDRDFLSNLLDGDDDNDSLLDTSDPFAIDAQNGTTTPIGVSYTWENNDVNPGGLLNLGFTGLMTNGSANYESLFDITKLTAGGAAGVLTLDAVGEGDATGSTNTQEQAFQFGVNTASATGRFTAKTRIVAPFTGLTPQGQQSMGLFLGTGNQDNYVKIVVTANGGPGGVTTLKEVGGVVTAGPTSSVSLPGQDGIDLFLTVDPVALTVQASYAILSGDTVGPRINVGSAQSIPGSWLSATSGLAVGIISTSQGPAPPFAATWDFIIVEYDETQPGTGTVVHRVNVGGAAQPGSPTWQADTAGSPSPYLSGGSGANQIFTTAAAINLSHPSIPAGTPQALFQSERWDAAGGAELQWSFPVTPGTHEVRLYFAEIYSGSQAVGARVFDVLIEGQLRLDNYDVYADVGANKGVVKSFTVESDAALNIQLNHVAQNPALKAIEILSGGSASSNAAPQLTPLPDVQLEEGQSQTVNITATDADNDPLTITASGLPAFVSLVDHGNGTATLTATPPLGAAGSYTINVTATDAGSPPRNDQESFILTVTSPPVSGPIAYRVNVGGPAQSGNPAWQADTAGSPSPYLSGGSGASEIYSTSAAINLSHPSIPAGTPQALFQSERWDAAGGAELQWSFPVTPGTHEVRLYFAEIYSGSQAVGARVFDVLIEGQLRLDNYDVYADVGANKGVVKSFTVESDAALNIQLNHVAQNPALKAIEILSGGSASSNAAPQLAPLPDVQLEEGQSQTVNITATDADNDPLTITASGLPAFATLVDHGNGTATLTATPPLGAAGSYTINVTATDAGSPPRNHQVAFTLEVSPINDPNRIIYRINTGGPNLSGNPLWQSDVVGAVNQTDATIDIGARLELFVDQFLIDSLSGAALQLHTPQLANSFPDSHAVGQFPSVLFDGTKYQHYYRGYLSGVNPTAGPPYPDGTSQEVYRYEESLDGIHWTQPNLNLFSVTVDGTNNVVLANDPPSMHNFMPFIDTNPNADPDYRYKAIAGLSHINGSPAPISGLRAYGSSDGIHWTLLAAQPVIKVSDLPGPNDSFAFDSANVAFWSELEQKYVVYYRTWSSGSTSPGSLRSITRAVSDDFITWTNHTDINVNFSGEHLYTPAVNPYFRAPHIYLAMPTGFYPSQPSDNTRILFMSSRGGATLDRTFGQQVFIQGVTGNRQNYAAPQIHQTGPGELSVYSQSGARYTLRLDGFASVDTSGSAGEMLTKPFTFIGDRLEINHKTGPSGSIRIEVQDASGQPIPGFALADSNAVSGDELARTMTWKGSADVSSLAGRTIRLRFVMQDADLYSIRFQGGAGLRIPKLVSGQIGDTVSVPVQLTVAEPAGLSLQSADVALTFDPTRLEVSGVRGGSLAPGMTFQTQWDNTSGTLTVRGTAGTSQIGANVTGDLFLVDFVIKNGAVLGETPVNLMAGLGAVTTRINAGQTPLRPLPTNAGGDAVDGSITVVGALFNLAAASSNTSTTTAAIDMSHPSVPQGTPQQVFQTDRWDSPQGAELQWDFPVPAGEYLVRLYFAETFGGAGSAGARVFDVSLEGQVRLDNYDIFADVGLGKGVVKSLLVTSDTNLDIDFAHVTENPKINGIEILQAHPLQNYQSPNDVNADGVVSPIDALIVINELNRNGARKLDSIEPTANVPADAAPADDQSTRATMARQSFAGYIDTNGDDHLSPIDALRIINQLNAAASRERAASQATAAAVTPGESQDHGARRLAELFAVQFVLQAVESAGDSPESHATGSSSAAAWGVPQDSASGTAPHGLFADSEPAAIDMWERTTSKDGDDLESVLADIAVDVHAQWQPS